MQFEQLVGVCASVLLEALSSGLGLFSFNVLKSWSIELAPSMLYSSTFNK